MLIIRLYKDNRSIALLLNLNIRYLHEAIDNMHEQLLTCSAELEKNRVIIWSNDSFENLKNSMTLSQDLLSCLDIEDLS